MEDRLQHHDAKAQDTAATAAHDITKEPYRGPGGLVTGAGYVQIYHFVATVVAFLGAAIVGAIAYKSVGKIEKEFIAYAEANPTSILGRIAGFTVWASQKVVEHIPFVGEQIEKNKNSEQAGRWSAAAFAGGVVGGITWLGSLFASFFYGVKEGNQGKSQFERAKNEILDLREQQDDLRSKYLKTSSALEEARAKQAKKASKEKAIAEESEHPKRRDDQKPGNIISSASREATIAAQQSNAIATQ